MTDGTVADYELYVLFLKIKTCVSDSMAAEDLILMTISVVLILIKDNLKKQAPKNPQEYPLVWNFYRSCVLYAITIEEAIDFLQTDHLSLHPDIHFLVTDFCRRLKLIKKNILRISIEAESDTFDLRFHSSLQCEIEQLCTTLCSKYSCRKCLG